MKMKLGLIIKFESRFKSNKNIHNCIGLIIAPTPAGYYSSDVFIKLYNEYKIYILSDKEIKNIEEEL